VLLFPVVVVVDPTLVALVRRLDVLVCSCCCRLVCSLLIVSSLLLFVTFVTTRLRCLVCSFTLFCYNTFTFALLRHLRVHVAAFTFRSRTFVARLPVSFARSHVALRLVGFYRLPLFPVRLLIRSGLLLVGLLRCSFLDGLCRVVVGDWLLPVGLHHLPFIARSFYVCCCHIVTVFYVVTVVCARLRFVRC